MPASPCHPGKSPGWQGEAGLRLESNEMNLGVDVDRLVATAESGEIWTFPQSRPVTAAGLPAACQDYDNFALDLRYITDNIERDLDRHSVDNHLIKAVASEVFG